MRQDGKFCKNKTHIKFPLYGIGQKGVGMPDTLSNQNTNDMIREIKLTITFLCNYVPYNRKVWQGECLVNLLFSSV